MDRRRFLHSGVALSCGLAGCLDGDGPSSLFAASPCPSTISRIEDADYHGEFRMECNTAFTLDETSRSLSDSGLLLDLSNQRDAYFNTQFYSWELLKHVDSEWYTVATPTIPATAGSSLAPGERYMYSVVVDNDFLENPVEPISGDKRLRFRALGGGTYAFVIVGSYGAQGASWSANQPFIGYAARFTWDEEAIPLVPTNTVLDTSREGETMTVTVGTDDPARSITVTRRPDGTPSEVRHASYITESVYGQPALRNVLAHFDEGITTVTLRTDELLLPAFNPSGTFTYEGTMYEVTEYE